MEIRIVKKISFILSVIFVIVSCESHHYYQDSRDLSDGWDKKDIKEFQFRVQDTINLSINLAFVLRNATDYEYSNLYLFTNFTDPKGKEMTDTLQYYIANPDGTWIGKGIGSKEQILIVRENLALKDTGIYKVRVTHGMRENKLKGLKDISLIVDKLAD